MASSSTPIMDTRLIEKFEGRNFQLWKWRMEIILRDKGLLNITNGGEAYPVDKKRDINSLTNEEKIAIETFLIKDNRAYSLICLSLGDLPARQIKSAKSSNEVWKKLNTLYETKNTTNRLILKKRLTNMRMKDNETMTEYLDKFRTATEELEAIGSPMEEEDLIATLLNSLPSSYDNLIVSLESRADQIDLDFIHARLLQEELRRDKRGEEDETLFISKTETKKEEANLTKGGKKLLSKEELSKVTCYYCNKKGHFANRCFKKISDKNKEGEEAHHTQGDSEYLFSSSTETHLDNLWYLDSGATMHMAYKRDIFKNYTKLDKPRTVKMGDHNIQRGIGIGDIQVNMKHGKFGILSKVLHVPGLKKNLLSISKISDLGFTVNFNQEKMCYI